MFTIEMLPAKYGDCLVVNYGCSDKSSKILVDAGTQSGWQTAIRTKIAEDTHFELFVLTHIDSDHIGGAIPLLQQRPDISFGDIWFNGWKHLPKRLLSAKQGEIFSTLISDRSLPWNQAFGGKAISVASPEATVTLPGNMRITLLSPTIIALERLARKWKKEIQRHGLIPGHHRSFRRFLARSPTMSTDVDALVASKFRGDSSVPNSSSIAFLAEFKDDKREYSVLFAGDAHANVLSASIKAILAERSIERLRLDAFKISHHGSRGNINEELLRLINCPRYLISCNGDVHNLPDNEAIARIIKFGGTKPELLFNYYCERTKAWSSDHLQQRYNFSATYGESGYYHLNL